MNPNNYRIAMVVIGTTMAVIAIAKLLIGG